MKLTFTTDQRINLHTILGAQRWDTGMIRAVWVLQDLIALSQSEEEEIALKREYVDGSERLTWTPRPHIPGKDYDLTGRQVALLKTALGGFPQAAATRKWLEPLLELLVPREEGEI